MNIQKTENHVESGDVMSVDANFFACHRGADRHGVKGPQWFLINETRLSLDGAKAECQGLFESGLIFRPMSSEFRICQSDGSAVQESRPPHGAVLHWDVHTDSVPHENTPSTL